MCSPAVKKMIIANRANKYVIPIRATSKDVVLQRRMQLYVHVRILLQYLERVDPELCDLARDILADCERQHSMKTSNHKSLAGAIADRLKEAVGETHWIEAGRIQKQLLHQRRRKMMEASMTKD